MASYCIDVPLTLLCWLHSLTQAEEVFAIIMARKEERRIIPQQMKVSN